jgi:hypothetical protein
MSKLWHTDEQRKPGGKGEMKGVGLPVGETINAKKEPTRDVGQVVQKLGARMVHEE